MSALEIAKAIGGQTAKDANKTLCAMHKNGHVKMEAVAPGSSKPLWSVT